MRPIALTMFMGLLVCGVWAGTAAAQGDVASQGRAVLEQHKAAVVTVRVVMETSSGGRSYESQKEITGTVIDPSGLICTALSRIDPTSMVERMRGGELGDFNVQIKDVKILLEDGSEIDARVVLRDKDWDLAFIRPLEQPEEPMAAVDLTQSGEPQILEQVVEVNRLGKAAGRVHAAVLHPIEAIIRKPRISYIPGYDSASSSLGTPMFSLDGKIVGISVIRSVKVSGGGMSYMRGMPPGVVPIILRAEDILEAAQQAPGPDEVKKEEETTPAEEPETTESDESAGSDSE